MRVKELMNYKKLALLVAYLICFSISFSQAEEILISKSNHSNVNVASVTIPSIAARKDSQKKYIIVVALKDEIKGVNLEQYAPVIYTGVGKINAAIKLQEAVLKYKPELVINFGTAGAIGKLTGLFQIDTFIQTDMDARGTGLLRGITPGSGKQLPKAIGIVLGTSDSFITDAKKQLAGLTVNIDLVDMEAFALREVCQHFGIEFQSYKYISDSANNEAASDWQKNANKGALSYLNVLKSKYGVSLITH